MNLKSSFFYFTLLVAGISALLVNFHPESIETVNATNGCVSFNQFLNISACNDNGTPQAEDDYFTVDIDLTFNNLTPASTLGPVGPISSDSVTLTGNGLVVNPTIKKYNDPVFRDTIQDVKIKANGIQDNINITYNGCFIITYEETASNNSLPPGIGVTGPPAVGPCSGIGKNLYVDSSNVTIPTSQRSVLEQRAVPGSSWDLAFTNLQDALAVAVAGDTIRVAQGTYYPATAPAPTYNVYPDFCNGQNNAIITAGNDSISIQFLTNNIEYVKIWNSSYSTFIHPQLDMSYLCDTTSSGHAVPNCDQGITISVNLPPGTYRVLTNYFSPEVGDCYVNFPNNNDVIIPVTPLPDRTISFNIPDGVVLLGGYIDGGSTDSLRSPECFKTILCGDIDQNGDTSNNSYHVVTTYSVDSTTTVDGFCITGGYANGSLDNRYGAGWFNRGENGMESSPSIRNCIITGNTTSTATSGNFNGGGMANYGDGGPTNPTLINTIISNNYARRGGGMYNFGANYESSPILINCIVSGNRAGLIGGGFYNDGESGLSNTKIINSVIASNIASNINNASAVYSAADVGDSTTEIANSIIWGNASNPFSGSANPNIEYSIIQTPSGNYDNLGNNKVGINPMFVSIPAAALTPAGDFHLLPGSPAFDMGLNSANAETLDLDGNIRIFNGTIDIGPYEKIMDVECSVLGPVVYVDSAATGLNNGSSWANAFTDLQDALMAVRLCGADTVKVAQGTYYPSDSVIIFDKCTGEPIDTIYPDRAVSFDIPDSAVVLGGYGHGADSVIRDWQCNKTILCGDIDRNGDTMNNSYHVVVTTNVDSVTVVDGFCITGGNANGTFPNERGGGWYNESDMGNYSNPTLINLVISGNNASNYGGGMYNLGEFGRNSSPSLTNVVISGNTANAGGGLANNGKSGNSSPILTNVVISGNSAIDEGAGMRNVGISMPIVINSIFWNNAAPMWPIIAENDGSSTTITYSIIQSGSLDVNTDISSPTNKPQGTDPLFINGPAASLSTAGDFHLMPGSPAFNMGDNAAITAALSGFDFTDLDGFDRINFGIVDIGVFEAMLNCTNDTIYVTVEGDVPPLALDSIIDTPVDPICSLHVNGVLTTEPIQFTCADTGVNTLQIVLIKPICKVPDTIYSCEKIVVVLDTFDKKLIAHDQLNVSLDESCMKVLRPHDVLTNFGGCPNGYEVELAYPLGTTHHQPANKLDRSHLGYCMVFSVVETSTGNRTWGKICVEDKKGPQIECFDDTITCFELANLPADGSLVTDACSGTQTKLNVISESFTDYGCDSAVYGVVTRRLVASDQWGNSVDCTRKLYIEKLHLDSIVCPRDTAVDCSLEVIEMTISGVKTKVSILDPRRSKGPMVKTKDGLKPAFGPSGACKLTSIFKDERHDVCGKSYKILRTWIIVDWCTGKEKECKQWIGVIDTTAPVPTNVRLPVFISDPHVCGTYIDLDTLKVSDCNRVNQRYNLVYSLDGKEYVVQDKLPAKKIWVPVGSYRINVLLVDECKNNSKGYIDITILDNTPPTPICDEFTQVTVDPLTCWTSVAAKDLDNGSRDNCCEVLHFAAAHMDSITYWRDYWNTRLETEVGKEAFWKDKAKYDEIIEEWINCYVFADSVHFDECGTNQVVLRVYEACGVPRYDPHIFPCSPHAWFCYNTYLYMGDFNFNWFDANGPKSCRYRPVLTSLAKTHEKYIAYQGKGYLAPKYVGAAQFDYCEPPFHVAFNGDENLHRDTKCPKRLYSDCMVQVLVDDKQAPVAYGLEDITVYCDGTKNALQPDCGNSDIYNSTTWPLDIKDHTGSTVNRINSAYGYYGGSDFLGLHVAAGDHDDPQACDHSQGWAPIYCRSWLLLDSTDEAGKRDYTKLFDKLLLFDKGRKQTADLIKSEFSITDNCRLNDASLKVENAGTVNSCGEGWLSRTWTIEDKCGNKVSATQKIYIKKRSDFEVIFPEDKVVTCDFLNRTDTTTRGAGRPVISDDECEQVGMQYKDEIFTVTDSACYKIVRTWTIIDWCTYDPNQHDHHPDVIVDDRLRADSSARSCVYRHIKDNNDGFMRYIQIIKVIDEIAPVVTCSDQTVCIDAACSTTVNIPLVGSDNCADEVVFRVEITKPDGSKEIRANIKAITGTVVEGIYTYQIIGKDRCGNEDTCTMKLTVKDCKKPTPYCYDGLATVIMPSTGTIEVWAKDFNVASEDNCTAKGDLKYSFSKDVTQASKVFTCADIIDGKLQGLIVEMWVTDKAGNQDLCKVSLQLQDNSSSQYPTGACKDTTASVAGVTGRLITEENEGVEKANVEILPTGTPSQALSYSSKVDGSYAFNGMPITSASYTLKAKRDDEPMNGVSTIDLVLIQKHILGTESLKTPYKMIAADANNDKDITAVDLVELRKLILGVYDKLPNNTSWKFVPKSYAFTDIQNPWSYPTEEVLTQMSNNIVKDFVGVKVGDVNASSIPHSLMGTEVRESTTGLIFELEDQTFKAGDKVEVSFRSPNFAGVSGFQGTISASYLKPHTSYLTPGKLGITDKNFGTRWANEGLVTMSWNTNTGIDINTEEVLFTMTFVAQKAGVLSEVMRIGSQRTKAESYEGKGELGNLAIRFTKNGKEVSGSNTLYQNYPNPFDQRTVIGLNLGQSIEGVLKITDVTGKVVKEINREWNKGYNEVLLSKGEIKSKGILFYSFESNEFNATKRMIVIE